MNLYKRFSTMISIIIQYKIVVLSFFIENGLKDVKHGFNKKNSRTIRCYLDETHIRYFSSGEIK